jgi:hypothetical protein
MKNEGKNEGILWAGFVAFLAAACANPRSASPAPAESAKVAPTGSGKVAPAESAQVAAGDKLVQAERPELSLADAIRAAAAGRDGFTPVAAGVEESPEGTRFNVALLSHRHVLWVSIDAATGKQTVNEESKVLESQDGFASKVEDQLPQTKIDLPRAVEIGLTRAAGARLLGAEIDLEDERLVYTITVFAGEEALEITVDPVSGEVLTTQPVRAEEDADAEMQDETTGAETGFSEDFEDVPTGELPDGWKIEATGTATSLASWAVVPDATAPSKGNALALTSTNHDSASTFNLCWSDEIRFQDGAIEASMKPMSGKEDEGGGLIWRVKDRNDYYVCRANPLEGNLRLYYVQDGFRHELASADIEISAGAWHRIRVEQEGEHIACSLDGKKLLETLDSTFPAEGGVGFWTKADAVTSFDDLLVTSTKDDRGSDEDDPEEEMDGDHR